MRTTTTVLVALTAIIVVIALSAAVQPRAEIVLDSRILSWVDIHDWWRSCAMGGCGGTVGP